MGPEDRSQKNKRYLVLVTVLTGVVLPWVAVLVAIFILHISNSLHIGYEEVAKAIRKWSVVQLLEFFSLFVTGLGYLASPYLHLAYKGYDWILSTSNDAPGSPNAGKSFSVMKWTYAGSVVMGFLFYFALAFHDLRNTEAVAQYALPSPAPYLVPAFGAGCGFLVGWFVGGLKPPDQGSMRDIDPI